jgi:hypothetical protein
MKRGRPLEGAETLKRAHGGQAVAVAFRRSRGEAAGTGCRKLLIAVAAPALPLGCRFPCGIRRRTRDSAARRGLSPIAFI